MDEKEKRVKRLKEKFVASKRRKKVAPLKEKKTHCGECCCGDY